VFALDSTGFARMLRVHPGSGVGCVVSPGLILPWLSEAESALLPKPVVGYGLVSTLEDVEAGFRAGAAAMVLEPDEASPGQDFHTPSNGRRV
jgi:glycerol-3-phosphate responsive antiterminator